MMISYKLRTPARAMNQRTCNTSTILDVQRVYSIISKHGDGK